MKAIELLGMLTIAAAFLLAACGTPQGAPMTASPKPILTLTVEPTPTRFPETVDNLDENYKNESYNGSAFGSVVEYRKAIENWESLRPTYPGLSLFTRGGAAGIRFLNSINQTEAVRNDKWQHCLWGATIARSTSFETAAYHAWLKESRDLTDDDASTNFDTVDYDASLDGARQATEMRACEECANVCEARWGNRSQPWGGLLPSDD